MIDFIKVNFYDEKIPACIPHKPEYDLLARIFESTVRMPYYYSLSKELHEILAGERIELEKREHLDPQENTVPSSDPSSYIILKVKNNMVIIEDLERNEIMDLDIITFTQYVDDWIKFVENIEKEH